MSFGKVAAEALLPKYALDRKQLRNIALATGGLGLAGLGAYYGVKNWNHGDGTGIAPTIDTAVAKATNTPVPTPPNTFQRLGAQGLLTPFAAGGLAGSAAGGLSHAAQAGSRVSMDGLNSLTGAHSESPRAKALEAMTRPEVKDKAGNLVREGWDPSSDWQAAKAGQPSVLGDALKTAPATWRSKGPLSAIPYVGETNVQTIQRGLRNPGFVNPIAGRLSTSPSIIADQLGVAAGRSGVHPEATFGRSVSRGAGTGALLGGFGSLGASLAGDWWAQPSASATAGAAAP